MIVSVMQPYFFPYVGYFSLIKHSDLFIVCDEVQHIKQGWMHRNRIISMDKEYQYIHTVIQNMPRNTKIKDVKMVEDPTWKNLLLQHLTVYARRAPYYKQVIEVVKESLKYDELSLSKWNANALKTICHYLGVPCRIETLSEMNLTYDEVNSADEWGLNLSIAVGADTYLNPPGGMSFYDPIKYESKGVQLNFIQNNISPYDQGLSVFKPGLSIIDVMMFNSIEEVNKLIDDFELITDPQQIRKELESNQ